MENITSDLEIEISTGASGNYTVEFTFVGAGKDEEVRLTKDHGAVLSASSLLALDTLKPGSADYREALTTAFFADKLVFGAFQNALSTSRALNSTLRIRLMLDADDLLLHRVHWECLNDLSGNSLATDPNTLFSRFLPVLSYSIPASATSSKDWTVLVAIANPSDLADLAPGGQALAPIDAPRELALVKSSISGAEIVELKSATLNSLDAKLREGCDVLYLVCHGYLEDNNPMILLCDEQGKAEPVEGSRLKERMANLPNPPRLVVLASCQSAQGIDNLASLLASAGVPAILAMSGNFSMETNAKFMPGLFRALSREGVIDKAVATARGEIRDQSDSWMPVLYMRLRTGRLWPLPKQEEVQPVKKPNYTRRAILTVVALAFAWGVKWAFTPYEPLKLHYCFIRQAMQDGSPVGAPEVLAVEEPLRRDAEAYALDIAMLHDGYFYAFKRLESGSIEVLFHPEAGSKLVKSGQKLRLPADPATWYSQASADITLVFAKEALFNLDTAIGNADRDRDGKLVVTQPAPITSVISELESLGIETKREVLQEGAGHSELTSGSGAISYRIRVEVK
jgi:hypothetical protein